MKKLLGTLMFVLMLSLNVAGVVYADEDADVREIVDEINYDIARDKLDANGANGLDANTIDNARIIDSSPNVQSARANVSAAEERLINANNDVLIKEQRYNDVLKQVQDWERDALEAESKGLDLAAANAKAVAKALTERLEVLSQDLNNAEVVVNQATDDLFEAEDALSRASQQALDEYYANRISVLPKTNTSVKDCKVLMNEVEMNVVKVKKQFVDREDEYISDVLGCGIKTGDIKLWMVPYYVRFILEFILQIGGLVAVGGIVYGGYLYLFAGVSDDKDRGKKAILYAAAGIVIMMVAWAFVNIVVSVLTA